MKAISLVFEYDFNKQLQSGRTWGNQGYKNKDFIFEYSAASFATFAHHNSGIDFFHEVLTDDFELLKSKIEKYNVNWSKIKIIEDKSLINEWKKHDYCFYPAMQHLKLYENENDQLIKLDNDLECLCNLDELINSNDILLWKHERNVSRGRLYWGEREASKKAFGTENYELYNIGVFGLPKGDKKIINELIDAALLMSKVDISNVVYFPENPQLKVSTWSCSEQTAYCYIIHKNKLSIKTVEHLVQHHCYGFDSKKECIEKAKFLLR